MEYLVGIARGVGVGVPRDTGVVYRGTIDKTFPCVCNGHIFLAFLERFGSQWKDQ